MKRELKALKKHILNIWITHCTFKNLLFPLPQHAGPLPSICCICTPGSRLPSEVFRKPKSWRTGVILHLTTQLPIWIPREMKF